MPHTRRLASSAVVLNHARQRVESMLAQGVPLRMVLTAVAGAAEQISGSDSAASILLIDKEGRLRNGASPNLPADYLDAIDGIKPDPNVGTCAAAAATGQIILTPDFCEDTKWAELKHLPMSIGYRGAWSMPIKDARGGVLGTLGTYFRQRRTPTDTERQAVAQLALLAAEVLASGGAAEGRS